MGGQRGDSVGYGQETCFLLGARQHLGVSSPPAGREENEQN